MRYEIPKMSKPQTGLKEFAPTLILMALMVVAYMAIRDRLQWNQDRINELVGKHAKLQGQVNELERRSLSNEKFAPSAPAPAPVVNNKVGDLSFMNLVSEEDRVHGEVIQWLESLRPGYDKLKAKHKPPKGRSIVFRVIFGENGKPSHVDYIKPPENKKLASQLKQHVEKAKYPNSKNKVTGLSLQLNIDP